MRHELESLPSSSLDTLQPLDLAPERQLKSLLLHTQTTLALHGPDSAEFAQAQKQACQAIAQTGLDPLDTRLAHVSHFLLAADSPLVTD